MGIHQEHTIVVMTNGDVYFLSAQDDDRLERTAGGRATFFSFIDVKSEKRTRVQLINISSIIEPKVVSDGVRY